MIMVVWSVIQVTTILALLAGVGITAVCIWPAGLWFRRSS